MCVYIPSTVEVYVLLCIQHAHYDTCYDNATCAYVPSPIPSPALCPPTQQQFRVRSLCARPFPAVDCSLSSRVRPVGPASTSVELYHCQCEDNRVLWVNELTNMCIQCIASVPGLPLTCAFSLCACRKHSK